MKTEKFAEQLRTEIAKETQKLEAAKAKAAHWKQREADAEEVLKRFRTALDALDGYGAPADWEKGITTFAASSSLPEGAKVALLNGEAVILEPGYEIGRNSFGEECIVPVGYQAPVQPEPTKASSVAEALPSSDAEFESPESLI